uniref:DUF1468 domain-containing protein n=1 Tax=Fervidicoccus fontis TaxID=683846 RepID=A0A7C1I711_9CREN
MALSSDFRPGSFVFALCALMVSALWVRESLRINTLGIEWGGPRLFPLAISVLTLINTLLIVVLESRGFYRYMRGTSLRGIIEFKWKEIATTVVLLILVVLYAVVIKSVGFVLATVIITLYSSLVFKAKLIDAVMVSLIISIGLTFLFKIVLRVPLPEGILGW